jgi:hypothetical protein
MVVTVVALFNYKRPSVSVLWCFNTLGARNRFRWISHVRPFFPAQARKDRVPGGPGFRADGRVGLSFLVYTISKNALAPA